MFEVKFIEMITHFHQYDKKVKEFSKPWSKRNIPSDNDALDAIKLEQKQLILYLDLHKEFYDYYSKFYFNYYKKKMINSLYNQSSL
jgi:hypothetical protein